MLLTATLQYASTRSLLNETSSELLEARADALAGHLDELNAAFLRVTQQLSMLPGVLSLLVADETARAQSRVDATGVLAAFATTDVRMRGLAIISKDGTVLATTEAALLHDNYSFRTYFQEAMQGRPSISDLYVAVPEVDRVPSIAYAVPVRSGKEVVGVAVTFMRASILWDLVDGYNGAAGAGSFSVLYDRFGIRIADSADAAQRFHPAGSLDPATIKALVAERRFGERTRDLVSAPIPAPAELERARLQQPGSFRAAANGKVNLVVAHPLRTVPWTLFLYQPSAISDARLERLVQIAFACNGLILMLAILAGLFFASGFLSPIRELTQVADRIRSGDLSVRVRHQSSDELGRLGSLVNAMIDALLAARNDLDATVQKRTASLNEANAELLQRNSELTTRRTRDTAWARALTSLTSEGDFSAALTACLHALGDYLQAPLIACYRLRGEDLVPFATIGCPLDQVPVAPSWALAHKAFLVHAPATLTHLPAEAGLPLDGQLFKHSPAGIVVVPLAVVDQPIGALLLAREEPLGFAEILFLSEVSIPLSMTVARHDLQERAEEYTLELGLRNATLKNQAEALQRQQGLLQEQAARLEAKNREVEEANRHKSEFLANMSHELRTPLNAILGFSELLLDETKDILKPDHQTFIRDVLASGRHLLELINDILDLSKIEAGRMQVTLGPVVVENAIGEAGALTVSLAQVKRIPLLTKVEPGLIVLADEARLRQILLNLLSNAIKFSEDEQPIELGAAGDGAFIRFWVRDHGPGMDEALLGRLFQPFVQGENAMVKRHKGTGLGLAISKKLVEQQGGTVGVESVFGKGSLFWFKLPAVAKAFIDPALPTQPPASTPPSVPITGQHILLADDHDLNRELARQILTRQGYRVSSVENGEAAIAAARRDRPALILLDLAMPVKDGLVTARELRADANLRQIPLVALTALAMDSDKEKALAAGFDAYLTKPVSRILLEETVARLVSHPPTKWQTPPDPA